MTDINMLITLTDAQYQRAQQKLSSIRQRETQLLNSLDQLNLQEKEADTQMQDEGQSMRALGADVLWKGWLGRSRKALNIELAQIRALKEQHMGAVRLAFGKRQVAQTLRDRRLNDKNRTQQKAMLDTAIEQSFKF